MDCDDSFITADPTRVKFTSSAVHTRVLFKANGTPALVEVYVRVRVQKPCVMIWVMINQSHSLILLQLPESLCYNQELNYTILVENSHGDLLTNVGPTSHIGPGLVKESVANVDWKQNQTYSLRVILGLKTSSEAIISEKHLFREYFVIDFNRIILWIA